MSHPEVVGHRPPDGACRTRRARPGRRIRRDRRRRYAAAERSQGGVPGGAARGAVAGPRHEHHGRAAARPPHRPHALGQPRQHGGEDLRRRPVQAPRARPSRSARSWPSAAAWWTSPTEPQVDIPQLWMVRSTATRIARHGLTVGERRRDDGDGVPGDTVSQVLGGPRAFDLVVQARRPAARTWRRSATCSIDTPSAPRCRCRRWPASSEHRARTRSAARTCSGRSWSWPTSPGATCAASSRTSGPAVDARGASTAGYYIDYGGQFESAEDTTATCSLLGLAVVVGIVLLLQVAFGSVRDALLVMVNLPLALIGGVVARLRRRRRAVSVASLVGLHHAVRHRHPQRHHAGLAHPAPAGRGGRADFRTAVHRGAMERLRRS